MNMAEALSPFRIFNNWLFDGDLKSPIPIEGDLLKYNSPINETYMLNMFMNKGNVVNYLDKYLNNANLRYIEKEDLFMFMKRLVYDFKLKKYDVHFHAKRKYSSELFNILQTRFPLLKVNDLELLIDRIEVSEEKSKIYSSLGIDIPKKDRIKKKKEIKEKKSKMSKDEFIKNNFSYVEV